VFCLVGDYAISENFIMANRVLIDAAAIAGVALDGVDKGQSRILCKLQNVVQIEQNLCKTGAAQAAYKITAFRGDVKGGNVNLLSSRT